MCCGGGVGICLLWGNNSGAICCTIVANVVLQVDSSDEWVWAPNPDTGYSVGGFYHMLTRLYPRETSPHNDLNWNKLLYQQRFPLLLGGLLMTGYPQSLIFLCVDVYVMILCYVQLVVMLLRISIIYFWITPFFDRFGVTTFPGWVSRLFFLIMQFRWHLNFVGLIIFTKN
jgi:hypothetical protein